ncbi:hypothetical protein SLEP1_g59796 [Rubroshorea leprosula]|uniref:Uncharacterized protein n=1 Tax=Rubroshorea leprosula TaxID=152421 RepID=A0AAV5MTD7_9ROSI|nr:hypothetical protein SLEP1_g59796 [Rubroshorea leprosula]
MVMMEPASNEMLYWSSVAILMVSVFTTEDSIILILFVF